MKFFWYYLLALLIHVVGIGIFWNVVVSEKNIERPKVFKAFPASKKPQEKAIASPKISTQVVEIAPATTNLNMPIAPPPPSINPPKITLKTPSTLNILPSPALSPTSFKPSTRFRRRGDSSSVGEGELEGRFKGINPLAGGAKVVRAKIFGVETQARRLGVIIDISKSMLKHHDKIIKEVKENFADAVVVNILSNSFMEEKRRGWLHMPPKPKSPTFYTLTGALDWLLSKKRKQAGEHVFFEHVDTVFIFSDFYGKRDKKIMHRFEKIFETKKVKVFMHCTAKKDHASASLKNLARKTGGEFITKKIP